MDTRKFVENIKKENSQNIKWITFGILSIVTSFYSATEFDYLFLAEPIALIVFASVSYYEKYLYLSEFGRTSGKPDTANLLSLTVLTKYHAFDVKQYFKILRRRFYVFQGIGVLCQMIWILLDGAVAASLIMAAAYVVVPMVVGMIIVYSEEDKQKTYQDTGAIVIVGFFKVIVEIFEVVLAAVSSILFLLLIVGVCGNGRIINALPKEQVVRIEDGGDVMMFAAIILMVLFLGTCLFTRLPVFLAKRNIKRIRIILGCLVVAVMTVYLLYSGCHYIRMEDGKFTIVSWGSRSEYTYDEINSLRLYNGDEALQAELRFRDGTKVTLFHGSTSYTEGWTEKYYSDYNYAAELVRQLSERGVSCTLEDEAALRKEVSQLDEECRKGFEDIVWNLKGETTE